MMFYLNLDEYYYDDKTKSNKHISYLPEIIEFFTENYALPTNIDYFSVERVNKNKKFIINGFQEDSETLIMSMIC